MVHSMRWRCVGPMIVLSALAVSSAQAGEKTRVKLNITRPNHKVSSVEGMLIYMDGKSVAKVYNDETKTVELDDVSVGLHQFKLYLDVLNLTTMEIHESLRPKGDDLIRTVDIPKEGVVDIRLELKDDMDSDNLITSCNWYFTVKVIKPTQLLGIELGSDSYEREVATEVLETPDGVEQEYEISRTLERTVTFGETTSLEVTGKLDLKVVKGEVCKKWEKETNHAFKQSETIRRNLKINGTKTPKLKVVWLGVYRKGSAYYSSDGEKKALPFEIQVGLRPQLKVIRD